LPAYWDSPHGAPHLIEHTNGREGIDKARDQQLIGGEGSSVERQSRDCSLDVQVISGPSSDDAQELIRLEQLCDPRGDPFCDLPGSPQISLGLEQNPAECHELYGLAGEFEVFFENADSLSDSYHLKTFSDLSPS
jgi:hypothetical protein